MQAAAAPAAPPPPPPPPPRRRRVYAPVNPRCEWASTEHADTLVVDVSGFRKEELKVQYSTNRKLTVTGERQVGGAQWARFLKVFPVPRSCDAGAITAKMNIQDSRLFVILPKRSSSSSSSKDKQEEHQSMGEQKGPSSAGGSSSGSSSGSLWSAQEDTEKEQREDQGMDEQRQEGMATHDVPRSDGNAANADKRDDGDDKGESKTWWKKIRVLHVLGCVLILALVGVGATLLYVMLL